MPQEQVSASQSLEQEVSTTSETQVQADSHAQAAADALDLVLDDIESTLEANAQSYVGSFIQQGGQ